MGDKGATPNQATTMKESIGRGTTIRTDRPMDRSSLPEKAVNPTLAKNSETFSK